MWDVAGPDEVIALLTSPPVTPIRPEIAKVAVARLEKSAGRPSDSC